MNLGTYDINIDFSKLFVHNNTSIYFKEGDLNTAKVRARLTMKNKPINIAGCNVTIRIEPSEGNTITDNATVIDPLNGIIEIDLKSNALLEGTHLFEVWIIKDESVKKSGKIGYRVLDSIEDAGSIEGANEYPILISLISDTNKAIQDAKEVLNIAKDMEANVNEAIGNTNVAISNAETATSNANSKITELDDAKTSMITKVDASIDTMNSSVEDAKTDMQSTTDAKMQQVDNSIANMKVETNTAIDNMVSKTDEKITDVNRAIAAGTKDLEVKEAREDASGVTYDTLKQMLDANLGIEGKTLKDFVIDMNGMKETQDLAYETNTGYKVCNDTQVGTIKDLKLCGKSLVNICPRIKTQYTRIERNVSGLVTIKGDIPNDNTHKITFEYINNNGVNIYDDLTTGGSFVKKYTDVKQIVQVYFNRSNPSDYTNYKIMILEGDHTQNPPSYFEGIASVGNGNEIEVSSVNGNLFDYDVNIKPNTPYLSLVEKFENGIKVISNDVNIRGCAIAYIENLTDNDLYFSTKATTGSINLKKYNNDFINKYTSINGFIQFKIPKKGKYKLEFNAGQFDPKEVIYNDIQVGNNYNYVTHKQDKKPILFKDTDGTWKPVTELRGIDLNNCDTIERHSDGKHYLHVRTEKYVVTGNEVIDIPVVGTNTSQFRLTVPNLVFNQLPICNMFKSLAYQSIIDEECVMIGGSPNIHFKLLKSKATTVDEFKQFAKTNNIELIVATTVEKIYEVSPLDLESYENETMILFDSGAISPHASWKITSSLPNFVKNIGDRVKRMENDFYKYTVTQNRMQLGTTYSSDRTTFRVDTATFSTEKAKQDLDYDLFRLLKHNILVGPHNYDKAEMENMMDFYVSVGKIDYNMWDELYMLIEEQHNPPVEEEAPVI